MVVKLLKSYKQTLWARTPQIQTPTDANQRATLVKNQEPMEMSVACWKTSEQKLKILKIIMETKTVAPITPTQTAISTILTTTTTKTVTEPKERREPFIHPVTHVGKQTTPQRNATLEPMQPTDRLPGTEDRQDKIRSKTQPIKVTLLKVLRLQPKIETKNTTYSLRRCDWQTGDN